jgi:hypothetical protein
MRAVNEGAMQPRKINVKREEVLAAIRLNYETHKREYAEACTGWLVEARDAIANKAAEFRAALTALNDKLDAATPDKLFPLYLNFNTAFAVPVPQNHAEEYEVIIRMLELSVDDVIVMDTAEVETYILDRWSWRQAFRESHMNYSSKLAK